MNEQRPPNAIEWTRVRNPDGTIRRGFTWNPIAGCLHDCEWDMPDGKRAECYAKTVAEKFPAAYGSGFAHYYWHPKRLNEPKRLAEGVGIFPDSMSDLFGHWVQAEHLSAVLDVMRETPQHIYQCLTKNTIGYLNRGLELPPNLWPGISSPPDHMWGHEMNAKSKAAYMATAMSNLDQLSACGHVTWMSFEPLSQDWSRAVDEWHAPLKWAVIGAASNGRTYYPPEERYVRSLIDVLDAHGVRIFFKGNMKSLPWAAANWRNEFPSVQATS